jgi:hypothetical protein
VQTKRLPKDFSHKETNDIPVSKLSFILFPYEGEKVATQSHFAIPNLYSLSMTHTIGISAQLMK